MAEHAREIRSGEDSRTKEKRQATDAENHRPARDNNSTMEIYLEYETLNYLIRHPSNNIELCLAYYDRGRKYLYDKQFAWALQDFKKANKLDHDKKLLNFPFKNVCDQITKAENLIKDLPVTSEYSDDEEEDLKLDEIVMAKRKEILQPLGKKEPIPVSMFDELLKAVNTIRIQANQAYKDRDMKRALHLYKYVCNVMDRMENEFGDEQPNKSDKEIAIDKIDAPCRMRWTTILMNRGNYEEALELFPFISPEQPSLKAKFQHKYSICHFNLKNYLEAQNAIERAEVLDPTSKDIFDLGNRIEECLHTCDDTIEECTKQLAIEPGNFKALVARGQAYFAKGYKDNLNLAYEDFDRALNMNGGNDETSNLKASVKKNYERLIDHGLDETDNDSNSEDEQSESDDDGWMGFPRNPVKKKAYIPGSKPEAENIVNNLISEVQKLYPRFTRQQVLHFILGTRNFAGCLKGLTLEIIEEKVFVFIENLENAVEMDRYERCLHDKEIYHEIEERIKANQEAHPEELEEVQDIIEYAKYAMSLLCNRTY